MKLFQERQAVIMVNKILTAGAFTVFFIFVATFITVMIELW